MQKENKNEKKYEWGEGEQEQILKVILFELKKELFKAERQERFYQAEQAKPTHVGKQVALERLGIYQQQMKQLTSEIFSLYDYAKDNDIILE